MKKTKMLTLCAVLTSLALALSYMERLFPLQAVIPLPGVKLGLANIVSLVALYVLGFKSAYLILVMRCFLTSFFSGSITSLMFSLTGGTLAIIVMALSMRAPFFSVYGVSILGAAAHNVGQIMVSMALMNSVYILYYLSYLLMVALVTGFATGAAASGVIGAFHRFNPTGAK